MARLKVRPKVDIAFKKIFTNNPELLKALIVEALDLKYAKTITLKPTELTPSNIEEKFCRIDVRAEVDGVEIDIEIQLNKRDDFRVRAEYYSSLLFTHLKKGNNYNKVPKTVVICFVDYIAFGCSQYHSKFLMMEEKRHEILSDKREIHFFELKKIPEIKNSQNRLEYFLNVINAETEEDVTELNDINDETIKQALVEVKRLNKDEDFVREIEAREIQLYEEQSALSAAMETGREEGIEIGIEKGVEIGIEKGIEKGIKEGLIKTALNLLNKNMPLDFIIETTGLYEKEINALKN